MKPAERTALTRALSALSGRIAQDLRAKMRADGPARERARKLHAEERVGEDFEVWTDLLSRRAAVLWVLKSVYARALEDRGLLSPGRLLDAESQQLFERLAPNLGETAFLRWIWRDLASAGGGLPELFAPQPAEVAEPSDALSRELLELWRRADPDTGARFHFEGERFDGELLGDLYQELDPVVKDRYALCQTPDFVRAFMLDRALAPAIEEYGADAVRVLDPACGSGHFLLDAFRALTEATSRQHPEWPRRQAVEHALERVVGLDLNDYACALARSRLVMVAAELAGVGSLAEAARFHPRVYWADALEQVERDQGPAQADLFAGPKLVASMTPPEVRSALAKVLAPRFQVVIANPPYIVERDEAKKTYHREKVGKSRRYTSAYREYSLAGPFVERALQLAVPGGYIGFITSNNFMKREFGKPLIEEVLARVDLSLVCDTSQAFIPFHGTPTVMLFARNRAPVLPTVRAVMGKRGETGTPEDPAQGRVWTSIVRGFGEVGFENEFVSVAEVARETLAKHPWSLGGGGAAELRERLETTGAKRLDRELDTIGFGAVTREDELFMIDGATRHRWRVPLAVTARYGSGEELRDWAGTGQSLAVFPYGPLGTLPPHEIGGFLDIAWRYRSRLWERQGKGFKTKRESGGQYYEYSMFYPDRHFVALRIAFAFVATHNHFVLDRGGKVFNRSAPVIKLPATATEDDHLALLGLLNSSTACFWMKQVFHGKGLRGQGGGITAEGWEQFYEFDATKLQLFPLTDRAEVIPYARALDALARARSARSVESVLAAAPASAAGLRAALDARRTADLADLRRMVALQEELDFLSYRLYGLDDGEVLAPEAVEPIDPNLRPVELLLAARDRATRDAIARGDETTEIPTAWFERHGWAPLAELPADAPPAYAARVAERLRRIAASPALALIEQPTFKRRWYNSDYLAQEHEALEAYLADRVEAALEAKARPSTIAQLVVALQDDARVLAAAEVLAGRKDFSLEALVTALVAKDAVPNHPFHRYKPTGLEKRALWEATWADQRREDAGEKLTPAVPPSYTQADFLKPEYFRLRGKLDVPKERFIAFTEHPTDEPLYGWAGWTPLERLRALLALDEQLEDEGRPLADRVGVLDSAWRLLVDVERDDKDAAARLRAELVALLGPTGPSKEMLAAWKDRSITQRPTKKRGPK